MSNLSGQEVKHRLRMQGTTLKEWAIENDYDPNMVWRVVQGVHKATFGKGYEIAVKLGMKEDFSKGEVAHQWATRDRWEYLSYINKLLFFIDFFIG